MNLPTLNTCRPWILALLAVGMPPFAACAEPNPSRATEQEIRSAEDQLAVALSKVDVDALSRLWADDFISTMADGRIATRKKRLESLSSRKPDAAPTVTNENQQVDVRLQGDWAIVLVTSVWVASGQAVGSPYQATHVWSKRDGRWRLVAAHISEVKS